MELRDVVGGPGAITLIGLDGKPTQMTHDQLAQMDQASLLSLRKQNPDQNSQDLLSGYEHRSAAREAGASNPLMGLSYGVAAPVYAVAKMLPRELTGMKSRSNTSLSQLGQGLLGAGEGIVQGVKNWTR